MKPDHYKAIRRNLASLDAMTKAAEGKDAEIKAAAEKRLTKVQAEIDKAGVLNSDSYLELVKERAALQRILQ